MTHEHIGNPRGHGEPDIEAEILAALWDRVPFPRLPVDAPPELKELVIEIENPKRVYTIHRATRRHNFHLLVEKFVTQLRYGCGRDDCSTSSCFSCRRRLARKAPIRRYSPTSARTLAVHLASQDDPERSLCPNLQAPTASSDAIKPLIFGPKSQSSRYDLGDGREHKRGNANVRKAPTKGNNSTRQLALPDRGREILAKGQSASGGHQGRRTASDGPVSERCSPGPKNRAAKVSINERPIRKDYRSFAANMFGTVAFKMLEWLTPSNMEVISDKAAQSLGSSGRSGFSTDISTPQESEDSLFVSSAPPSVDLNRLPHLDDIPEPNYTTSQADPELEEEFDARSRSASKRHPSNVDESTDGASSTHCSRNSSNARMPACQLPRPLGPDHYSGINLNGTLSRPMSPLSPTPKGEQHLKTFIRPASIIAPHRSSEQLTTDPSVQTLVQRPRSNSDQSYQLLQLDDSSDAVSSLVETLPTMDMSNEHSDFTLESHSESSQAANDVLPQTLSRVNSQTVNFICDVLQQDGTAENHLFEPQRISTHSKASRKPRLLKRRKVQSQLANSLRLEWKLFIEQSIFNILSDPHAILESFTHQNSLLDSQTLWFHMLRLTRTAPSLVFDSLWMASASLYAPPQALRSARSSSANFFARHTRSLSNEEAGFLISVCLHALVAAAPLVTDSAQLFDMSRIRSRGLTLSESGAVARQSSSLCLEYEDAFTDGMALRLAKRIFAAIPVRRHFDELIEVDLDAEVESKESDVLETLLSHIEPGREAQPPADFSRAERDIHEKRMPILILDWARTIMLNEWQGKPDIPGNGAFGGALSLIGAMYQKRKSLLVADAAFRAEYLGDRLDSIEMPVTWLAFEPSKQKSHLLDYPYIFHPSTLVSYFRAINFSRMSRSYEASSSLQNRISAIIATDSLVTDQYQKGALQDWLKVASSKFLILEIGRQTVIGDAFDQLWRRQERELLRPLKIHLGEDTGEEGFDSGGVQQEFFRLAIAEALNPDYGAFAVDGRTRMTWFQPGSLQPDWKLELIGLLVSLAIFNGLTLPITFPKALYMKLLGEPVTELHHIADGWPDLANGLTTLLEWDENDGAVEDIFARTYEFSIDMFGQPISREMGSSSTPSWPQFSRRPSPESLAADNPEDAPLVTGDNREAYVSDYIKHLTDISVAPQYEAFARGFRTCLHPKSLRLLTPALLQSVVEGTQEIDVGELRRAARYVGWDASHRTVLDFWSIVRRYDDAMLRRLLEFVTASDRLPVGGCRNVQFVIQKNGAEEGEGGHLPTAYTCYGTLLLPEYRDREVLRERLGMALENAQGFGFA